MQILSSGSFINLENHEKIEQLVFTAKELAQSAVKTQGFDASEESKRNLAIEIWQGAEYMCRDIEEIQIKNIFISNFLERLEEIKRTSTNPSDSLPKTEITPNDKPPDTDSKDEYLGLISTDQDEDSIETANDLPKPQENLPPIKPNESEKRSEIETARDETKKTTDISETEEMTDVVEEDPNPSDSTEESKVKRIDPQPIKPIILPEQEPYNFEKCTVNATIQLLPTNSETRNIVLSVKTHDFTPQISVHEINGEFTTEKLLPLFETAIEKYKSDLPVKVIDKLRKEKEKGKKKSETFSSNVRTSITSSPNSTDNSAASSGEPTRAEVIDQDANKPVREANPQGSLFG